MSIDQKQAAAEQVRAHLVMVRGGAPFLSPIDSRLLVEWLDASVPVDVILTAIEVVAARRTKNRIRSPLSLNSVKSVVRKGVKKPPKPAQSAALSRLIARLGASKEDAFGPVLDALSGLDGNGVAGFELLQEVLQIARAFHERVWEESDQEALKALAEEELTGLKEMLSAERYKSAVEEVARDNLRKRYKLLSASHLSQAFRS